MLYLIVSETSKQQWLQKNISLSPKCQSECKHSEVDMAVPVPRKQISSALAAWFPSALPWSSWLKMAYQLMCWVCVPTSGVMGHCTGMEGTTWKWQTWLALRSYLLPVSVSAQLQGSLGNIVFILDLFSFHFFPLAKWQMGSQGIEPKPLHQELGVLTTGPPGKS